MRTFSFITIASSLLFLILIVSCLASAQTVLAPQAVQPKGAVTAPKTVTISAQMNGETISDTLTIYPKPK